MHKYLFVPLSLVFLLGLGATPASAATCNTYSSGTTPPSGYAAAWNTQSSARELLVSADCTTTTYTLSAGSASAPTNTQAVYGTGYYWTGSAWQSYTLSPKESSGTSNGYILGTAQKTNLPYVGATSYVVAFSCISQNNTWKCGCGNSSCQTAMWQLQSVAQPTSGGGSGGGSMGGTVVLDGDFSGDWVQRFGKGHRTPTYRGGSYVERVQGGSDQCLRVWYKNGTEGTNNGMWFFAPIETPGDHFMLEYKVRFMPGFDFRYTGKLFGVCGGECISGGEDPNGTNGWSDRTVWRVHATDKYQGTVDTYTYHMDQPDKWGDDHVFGTVKPGTIHTIRQEVKLNTPGQSNGVIRRWFDGSAAYERTNLRFRTINGTPISILTMTTIFGGNGPEDGSHQDQYIDFCHVTLSRL